MSTTAPTKEEIDAAIDRLVEEYRSMCLWFVQKGYLPKTDAERLMSLGNVERYGDRRAFTQARELRN